jgi:hypothetical protein
MSNTNKSLLLGENFSTASNKLRKLILFSLVQRLELDLCYRCKQEIETVRELSIEHTKAWMSADDPVAAFYNLDDIRFSHLDCNSKAIQRKVYVFEHGTRSRYRQGCKCEPCRQATAEYQRQVYTTEKRQKKYAKEKDNRESSKW